MVKFQEYWVEKVCKCSGPCRYRGVLLRIPKKFHSKVDPFIGSDLKVKDVTVREVVNEMMIDIVLVTDKMV